jgi:hypothetical protein
VAGQNPPSASISALEQLIGPSLSRKSIQRLLDECGGDVAAAADKYFEDPSSMHLDEATVHGMNASSSAAAAQTPRKPMCIKKKKVPSKARTEPSNAPVPPHAAAAGSSAAAAASTRPERRPMSSLQDLIAPSVILPLSSSGGAGKWQFQAHLPASISDHATPPQDQSCSLV